jgi:hypothetical protein
MITDTDVVLLQGLTSTAPIAVKLEDEQTTLLHSIWFALELPTSVFSISPEYWKTNPLQNAVEWRARLPVGESAYGAASKFADPTDNALLVKLIADTGIAIIHSSIFNVVMKHVPNAEFQVFSDVRAPVAILQAGKLIGATAQAVP